MPVRFRIVGTNLPGRNLDMSAGLAVPRTNVFVGVQRGSEVVSRVPGDAPSAIFEFEAALKDGRTTGPFFHGPGDGRFIYLSWGQVDSDKYEVFRRIKLLVEDVDLSHSEGMVVEARLELTDSTGGPRCGTVRPPRVTWRVTPPG